ncbi:MAG: polysaccharide deacetylase family protein [Lachnospiraceae bacterium]|nr:polysaccharide deacetylase family protein [Lachnospiraceae bacterium]
MKSKIRSIIVLTAVFVMLSAAAAYAMVDAKSHPSSDAPYGAGPFAENPGETVSAQVAAQAATAVTGRNIDPSKPMIALTYDDGPQTSVGNRIMDVMLKYDQRCTFFLVGDRIPSRAEEVKRMADNGFEIANHSYSHKYLNKCDAATIRDEIAKCNENIKKYAGVTPVLMRLPGGNKNDTVLANVNMPIILWNVDTLDWSTRNTQKTIDAVLGKVKDGDIVLMHELYTSTAEATEYIVPKLVEQGFQLVTVSELAQYKGVVPQNNKIYYSFR